jgi:hypothetical protein
MKATRPMIALVALVFILVLPSAECSQSGRPSGGQTAPTGLGGIWYLRVDRTWDGSGNPGFPWLLLAESTYSHISNGPTYRVVISGKREQGYEISIGDTPIKGYQQPTYALQYVFELRDGTFAGGRFLIMHGKNGLEGELTIYGSGLPITKSERGALTSC